MPSSNNSKSRRNIKNTKNKSKKDNRNILTDTALRRIYHQEGLRFSQAESETIQQKLSDWILKTGWISTQYAKHVGRKSVSQQDIGRALSIQGIESVSELKKFQSQLGGARDCATGETNSLCTHNDIVPFGVVNDPAESNTGTCFKPGMSAQTDGGGRGHKQSRKKRTKKLKKNMGSRKNNRQNMTLYGGYNEHAIKHVQYNPASPENKPICKHDTDNSTFNLVNRSSFPLYKYDNLFDLDGVDVVHKGGNRDSNGAFKQIHQTSTPVNMITKTLKSLEVSRWSKDAIGLLHQAAEHRLRNIIHQMRN